MELDTFNREFPVPQAHDDPCSVFVRSPGADFQIAWQILLGDDQRVVAGRGHRRRQAAKDGLAIMLNLTGFAVHQVFRAHHLASEGSADGLVSEADSEQRHITAVLAVARKVTDQFYADAGFLRGAGSGRKHDAFRMHRLDLSYGHFVVAANLYLGAQFAKVLDEVVSERIVVIEDEDHKFIVAPGARFHMCGDESTKPYLTGVPPIAMLTGNFRQVFETLKPCFWSGSMAETQQDQDQDNNKRATRRFTLRLPVSVRYGENEQEHEAQTRDVSARGICFYVDSAIQAGSAIDFTLTLPPEITLTESIRVRCKGRVVRVEGGSPAQKMAVAAVIDEYDFLADV
jgi:hypothetical protein